MLVKGVHDEYQTVVRSPGFLFNDEEVLASVMEITGSTSKTAAVEKALTEMARKHKLKNILREGMGMTPAEIKASYNFSASDSLAELPSVAEKKPVTYRTNVRKRPH